jgi:hypothetical protein
MKSISLLLTVLLLLETGCQRKLTTKEIESNLEKAMTTYLLQQHRPDAPPLHFDMIDVNYSEDDNNYRCRFTIKLYRPDGTDTTGTVNSTVSKDFSTVTPKQ